MEIMKSKIRIKISVLFIALLFAGCGDKSSMTGEVVPLEWICNYEKAKLVAVEGYLAPNTMRCERAPNKKTSGITGCTFLLYANADQSGARIPVYILTASWMSARNNRIEDPASYTGDVTILDGKGNPLPKKDLQIYDNEGNLIPSDGKIRIYGELPNSDKCEFRSVERIDRIS